MITGHLTYGVEAPITFGNRLLDGLPAEVRRALRPYLHGEPLRVGQTLLKAGVRAAKAYFPTSGIVSLKTPTSDGIGIEGRMVGWEGMLPLCVVLGSVPGRNAEVQIAGTAFAINAAELQHQMRTHPVLERALLAYVQTQFNAVCQIAVCNGLHVLEQLCARWLLLAHDRVSRNEIRVTHEVLARLLGVRRPGITVAAQALQDQGLIAYRRGTISIQNRRGLEAAACECYAAMAGDYVRQGQGAVAPDLRSPNAQGEA